MKAEIPGVEQKDINVSLHDQVLTIRGEKHHEKEEKDEKYHRVERSWGTFTRAFRMPAAVSGDKVTAAFKDGTLTVMLPKAQRPRAPRSRSSPRSVRERCVSDDLDDLFAACRAHRAGTRRSIGSIKG